MLIKALLNYEDCLYCGTRELNNAHQNLAKLHRLLLWNSRIVQCSSKHCFNCIDFSCGAQVLNNANQRFAKLHRHQLWNSRIKQG